MRTMRGRNRKPGHQFDLSGGTLCLDFANTVSHRSATEKRIDHLVNYGDLVDFAEQSRLASPALTRSLRAQASLKQGEAQSVCDKARSFRETVYRTFSAIAAGKPVPHEDVKRIGDFALEALNHRRLTGTDGDYRWEWQTDPGHFLDRVFWPVAQSAADLLTSRDRTAVRECRAPDCEWLFLDHSRNGSRRWCDMKSCGNREKARRHYQRTHR